MAVGEAAAAKLADVADVVIMIMGAEAATADRNAGAHGNGH